MFVRKLFFTILMIISLFSGAQIVLADIVINEVAWMGTSVSANDEWIELYNTGTSIVDLTGWILVASDGSPSINLTGSINGSGYYLAERTDDSTVPTITAGVIYSGSLSNSGETLVLKNNSGQTVDTITMSSGWTAGDATTRETMQRNGQSWITGTPTPGTLNVTSSTTDNHPPADDPEENTVSTPSAPIKTKTEKEQWEEIIKQIDPDPKYSISVIIPDTVVAEVPIKFEAEVKKYNLLTDITGKFQWSAGDGASWSLHKNEPVSHTYHNPGNYVVSLKYFSNVFKEKPDSLFQKTIAVIPAAVSVHVDSLTGGVTVANLSTGELDLENWKITNGTDTFIPGATTIIPKGESIIIPKTVHRLENITNSNMVVMTPTGYVASTKKSGGMFKQNQISSSKDIAEESLIEQSMTASVIPLQGESTTFPIWIISFIVLVGAATAGFYGINKGIGQDTEST